MDFKRKIHANSHHIIHDELELPLNAFTRTAQVPLQI